MHSLLKYFLSAKLFRLLAKLALTAFAFWLAFAKVDGPLLLAMLERQKPLALLASATLIATQILLGTLRWRLILRALAQTGQHVMTLKEAFRIYYISVFFNACLPGTIGGDVVRVWMSKSDHIPLTLSIHSVIIDRMIALIALILLAAFTLPLLGETAGFSAWPVWLLLIPICFIGIRLLAPLEKIFSRWQNWRIIRGLAHFVHCLRLLLIHRQASAASLFYALLSHACYCFSAYALADSLGVQITTWQALTLIPPVMLATTLPVSIGGWGVREASMVGMLHMIGVPASAAVALSVQLGIIGMVLSLPAGVLWFYGRKRVTIAEHTLLA